MLLELARKLLYFLLHGHPVLNLGVMCSLVSMEPFKMDIC